MAIDPTIPVLEAALRRLIVSVERHGPEAMRLHRGALKQAWMALGHPAETLTDYDVTVHFLGGPWDGQSIEIERVVGPVFGVGHDIGNHYWLDTKSDPPTYHWDGTEVRLNDGGDGCAE